MQLKDLLDELRLGMLNEKSDSFAGSSDRQWSDDRLVRYINEAERRFATDALVIRDATTPEIVEIPLVTGQTQYNLHPSVLAVISARLDGTRIDLQRAGHSIFHDISRPVVSWNAWMDRGLPDGQTLAYSTDEGIGTDSAGSASVVTLTIYPAPSPTWNGRKIYLRVVRLPKQELSLARQEQSPEIPANHHMEMLDYAAYLALRVADHDANNSALAQQYLQTFNMNVLRAKREVMRKLFVPTMWAFGWHWEK